MYINIATISLYIIHCQTLSAIILGIKILNIKYNTYMDKLKLFGKRIKELRKRCGYTQEQLSEKIGLFPKQIGNIETGNCFTTMNNLVKLSEAFGVEIKDLFDFEYKEEREIIEEKLKEFLKQSSDEELRYLYRIAGIISK